MSAPTAPFDLRRERRNAGMSVRRLASACRVSRNTIDLLEEGREVRLDTAKKVADFWGVTVEDLLPTDGPT